MKKILAVFAAMLLTGTCAFADQIPKPLPDDARIKEFIYEEENVYVLNLHLKTITSIQFGPEEKIESVLVGDSASWEIIRLKRGNVLSVKPLIGDALTNMTVYSDKRVYTFELRAHPEIHASAVTGDETIQEADPDTVQATQGLKAVGDNASASKDVSSQGVILQQNYRAKFRYPKEEAERAEKKRKQAIAKSKAASKKSAKKAAKIAQPRNYNYYISGNSRFAPVEVYDSGGQTFFTFPENAQRPAIFKVGTKGRESLVNLRSKGNTIIADSVHNRWTIRIGDEAVYIADGSVVKK